MKLETAPTAGPWPQAARAWMELGLWGSAACQRCPSLCSCCLPCLKGQTQLTLHHPAAHSRPTLAVTAAPGDGIWPRHRLGSKCPLQATYNSDSESLPWLLHCACLAHTCQGHAAQSELLRTCRGRSGPRLQSVCRQAHQTRQPEPVAPLSCTGDCSKGAEIA